MQYNLLIWDKCVINQQYIRFPVFILAVAEFNIVLTMVSHQGPISIISECTCIRGGISAPWTKTASQVNKMVKQSYIKQ